MIGFMCYFRIMFRLLFIWLNWKGLWMRMISVIWICWLKCFWFIISLKVFIYFLMVMVGLVVFWMCFIWLELVFWIFWYFILVGMLFVLKESIIDCCRVFVMMVFGKSGFCICWLVLRKWYKIFWYWWKVFVFKWLWLRSGCVMNFLSFIFRIYWIIFFVIYIFGLNLLCMILVLFVKWW